MSLAPMSAGLIFGLVSSPVGAYFIAASNVFGAPGSPGVTFFNSSLAHQWQSAATLCRIQNYTECKIVQSPKLGKVQNYVKCKIMQGSENCKV